MKKQLWIFTSALALALILTGCGFGGEQAEEKIEPLTAADWPTPQPTAIPASPTIFPRISLEDVVTATPVQPEAVAATSEQEEPVAGQGPAGLVEQVSALSSGLAPVASGFLTSDSAAVRQGPGESYGISETVEKGELAGIFGRDESGNWLYVITSSLSPGWLPADTLRVIGDMTEAPVLPPNPLAAFANTITSSAASVDSTTPPPTVAELSPISTAQVNVEVVNLRQGPGPNYSQLGMLTGQDQVELLAVNKLKDWALIKTADGVTGWVGLEFLNPGGSVADAPVVLSARS